jgi:L-fucose isomerase-like protein
MTVNVIPFFSPLLPNEIKADMEARLRETGSRVVSPDEFLALKRNEPENVRRQHNSLLVGTGGTENIITGFLDKSGLDPPIVLLAHSERNSLPAAMEVRTYLQKRGVPARLVHAPFSELAKTIHEWSEFSRTEERIRAARLAIVGKPSPWLVASTTSATAVRKRWGTTIIDLPLAELIELLEKPASEETKASLERFMRDAVSNLVPEEDSEKAVLVSQALEELMHKHNLDAVSLECFTLLDKAGVSGCCAVSRLNDLDDVVAGCEGDVPAAFTMMLAKLLTGRPAFMANIAAIDEGTNSIVAAHCSIPTSVVEEYEIVTHFETGKSVAIRGKFPLQPITILKVWGDDLSKYWISKGEATENLVNETGCRTQVRATLAKPVSHLLDGSLGNHHVIVPGDYADMMERFFAFTVRK